MSVESQYYIKDRSPEGVSENVLSVLAKDTQLINWLPITENEKNINIVFHGPFSEVHMERFNKGNESKSVLNFRGDVLKHPQTGEDLWIPKTTEVGGDDLSQLIDYYLSCGGFNKKIIDDCLSRLSAEGTYGNYQLDRMEKISEDESYDPSKIVTAFALKLATEKKHSLHEGNLSMVLHTSVLYFLTQGDAGKIPEKLKILDSLASELGITINYENIIFHNKNFSKVLQWAEDPEELLSLFPQNLRSTGLCIDIDHLQRLGWEESKINNLIIRVSSDSRIKSTVIHAKQNSSVLENSSLLTAYTTGMSIVYEPKD